MGGLLIYTLVYAGNKMMKIQRKIVEWICFVDRCQEILSDLRCPCGQQYATAAFNAADTAIVGRFDGRQALAAVGSNTMVISLFVNMFVACLSAPML